MKSLSTIVIALFSSASVFLPSTCWGSDPPRLYTITTLAELQNINNDLDGSYILANDIDASDTLTWNGGEGFVPIGNQTTPFTGQLDGQLHTIENLYINRPGSDFQGLIGLARTPPGATHRTTVENLRLEDVQITAGRYSGTLIGAALNVLVTDCGASGNFMVRPDGSTDAKSGGLIGNTNWGSDVERCFTAVSVDAGSRVQVGGLIGYHRGVEVVTRLTNSYSRREVIGTGWAQGNLVGTADGSQVDRCYSSGSGQALIGSNFRDPVITRSYWNSDTGPASSPNGGSPKTTAEMRTRSTYVDWDFDSIWQIVDTQTYPWFQTAIPVELMSFTVD